MIKPLSKAKRKIIRDWAENVKEHLDDYLMEEGKIPGMLDDLKISPIENEDDRDYVIDIFYIELGKLCINDV